MRPMAMLYLVAASALSAAESGPGTLHVFGLDWQVPVREDWRVQKVDGVETLELTVPRPSTQPRRPTQYALAETEPYRKLTLELEVKQEPAAIRNRHNSLMFVYAWRDRDHFNYVHISVDAAKAQPVHNGVFHVYGGDRVRISSEEGPAALKDESWHKVKLVYDGDAGRVDVWVDGQTSASLRGVDLSLGAGKFGIGSFFDMGSFRNVKVSGVKQLSH
ncbi:MAG: hypothetical protein U0Q18_00420 [Bryobacteraceae bacterium]